MPSYLFFPYIAGGVCLSFEAADYCDDDAALAHASCVLSEHGSAVEVVVWEGERPVGKRRRSLAAHCEREVPEASGPLAGWRMLIVEADYYAALDLAHAVRAAGADVVASGADAKARILLERAAPDAAVVDVGDGEDASLKIVEALSAQQIGLVLVTSYHQAVRLEDHVRVQAISQPFVDAELVQAITEVLPKDGSPRRPAEGRGVVR